MVKSQQILKSFLIFALLFSFLPSLWAAEKIVEVRFVGLGKTGESMARKRILSVEGTLYSAGGVKRDIKALYEMGTFQDVSVQKESVSGGVRLTFHVQEKGVVNEVSFEGNHKIKAKDLAEVVSVRRFSPADEKQITESIVAIQKKYDEKGMQVSEVVPEIVPVEGEEGRQYNIIFHIDENRGVRIKRISFVGNKFFSDSKLAGRMSTKVKGFLSFISGSGKLKDEKLERDVDLLTYFYLDNGFIKAKVGKPQISLTRDKKALTLTIPVYEGPRYKVTKVDVGGDILTTHEELLSKLTLKENEIYKRSHQDQDSAALVTLYGDQAYAFANIYPVIRTDDENKTAAVAYQIEKGRKILVERIEITGNTITRDKVIRRELQVKENAPYSKSALELSRRRLFQLGYFSDVNFSTPRGSADDRIVLVVDVKEKPTGTFSLGAGFSSLESFVFNASVQKDNFFGLGLSGGVSANISKLRQEFSFNISDRYFLDTHWIFSALAYRYSSALNRDFNVKSIGGSVSFGRELVPFLSLSAGYQIEDIEVSNFSSQVPLFFQRRASGLTSGIVSTLAYDRRDNRILTTRGFYQAVTSQYAGNGLGGENNFWKITTDTRGFLSLPLKTVLKTRGTFSYIKSLDDNAVPLFERFFLGGINTLRGYDLNSIGPELQIPNTPSGAPGSFVYGGNRMLLFNLEYEVPVVASAGLYTVVFADTGQAYAENESIDLTRFRSDYGFGLRWRSPFGPMRFEWGFPIKKRSGESSTVFNFSIGQSF